MNFTWIVLPGFVGSQPFGFGRTAASIAGCYRDSPVL